MSNAAQEAAAALVPQMVSQLVEAMPLASEDVLAADLAAAQSVAAAPETVPSSQPQTAPVAAAPAPAAAPEAPVVEEEIDLNLDPVIPDDLQALLDEPDFEEEASLEVTSEQDEYDEDATDPETAKKVRALEKRNAWLEERVVTSERKKWVAENLKAYPLLQRYAPDEVAAIAATSRRAFARQAAGLNGRLATMLKPALDEIADARKLLRGEVSQEVRQEYKEGWGTITTGPATVPVEQSAYEAELAAARKTGVLANVYTVMMKAAGVNNNT